MSLRERLARAKSDSERELELIEIESPDAETIYSHLKRFIICRFLLDDGFWDDRLMKLAEHSVDLLMASAHQEDEGLGDLSLHCTSSSSAETKCALLLITLRKRLDLSLDPTKILAVDTVPALADEIARQLSAREQSQRS